MIKYCALLFIGLTIILGSGCTEKQNKSNSNRAGKVVARVDGSPITEQEVDYALNKITGGAAVPANKKLLNNVLDSLIASRAMSILAEKDLSETELDALNVKVNAYREELLAKVYIDKHATPVPVSSEAVEQYYERHINEFGGKTIKSFEYLTMNGLLDDESRAHVVSAFQAASKNMSVDLKSVADRLKGEGLPVKYKQAEMSVALIGEPIKTLLETTQAHHYAPIYNQQDQIALVRVNASRIIGAKSLHEVEVDIRKMLAPMQVKKAVSRLVEKVKDKVKIEYLRNE